VSSEAEVLFEQQGALGVITLNRPEALNALTLNMAHEIEAQLLRWRSDPAIRAIVITGAGRAFCAGGDIRALYDTGLAKQDYPYNFYRDEYRLNMLIKHYPKPYIALLNGIVMGGGVGVSVHGGFRVVSENLRFAMPETGIGLFPDVGFILSVALSRAIGAFPGADRNPHQCGGCALLQHCNALCYCCAVQGFADGAGECRFCGRDNC